MKVALAWDSLATVIAAVLPDRHRPAAARSRHQDHDASGALVITAVRSTTAMKSRVRRWRDLRSRSGDGPGPRMSGTASRGVSRVCPSCLGQTGERRCWRPGAHAGGRCWSRAVTRSGRAVAAQTAKGLIGGCRLVGRWCGAEPNPINCAATVCQACGLPGGGTGRTRPNRPDRERHDGRREGDR